MNFLQRFKITRELSRLEQKARENPSPTTFVDIAQVYINLGMIDQTLRIAEQGLALFPVSEELKKVHRFARRSLLNGRIQDLRKRIAKQPAPEHYQQLAEIYLELADFLAVQGTCEECIRRFPKDHGAYLVLARARIKTFYRDLMARDGQAAHKLLQKVIELSPEDQAAHKLMAELLYRIGAVRESLKWADSLRHLAPEDQGIEDLRNLIASRPLIGDDVEAALRSVEETGKLAFPAIVPARKPESAAAAVDALKVIGDALARLVTEGQVTKAAYIRGSQAVVRGDIHDGKDPFLKLARVISRASQRTCRRMEVGNFNRGLVEGPFGRICLCCYGEVISAVLCSPQARPDKVLGDLHELVSDSLAGVLMQEA